MGKILLISFEDEEEIIVTTILSALDIERKTIQVVEKIVDNIIEYRGIVIHIDRREVFRNNQKVYLTYTEFEILYLLAKNPGRVFSKEQIYDMVWKEPCFGDCNIVMSHIQNIRKKIEDDTSNPIYIQTVWGVGYRFNKEIGSNL